MSRAMTMKTLDSLGRVLATEFEEQLDLVCCPHKGRVYRLEILIYENTIEIFADGKIIHAYYDCGAYGETPSRGRFGIRQFGKPGLECGYDNFSVASLRVTR